MTKESAGIILYKYEEGTLRVLLGHMGGPVHSKRNVGSWSIPKGKPEEGEDLRMAALREFEEEVGVRLEGDMHALTSIVQRSGKRVHAFAIRGDLDVSTLKSDLFSMEWPPGSGKVKDYPELDRVAWVTITEAMAIAIVGQAPLFEELEQALQQGVWPHGA